MAQAKNLEVILSLIFLLSLPPISKFCTDLKSLQLPPYFATSSIRTSTLPTRLHPPESFPLVFSAQSLLISGPSSALQRRHCCRPRGISTSAESNYATRSTWHSKGPAALTPGRSRLSATAPASALAPSAL